MKITKGKLLASVLLAVTTLLLLGGQAFADPNSTQVNCKDRAGKIHQVTATKSLVAPGNILDIKDFKKACKNKNKNWVYVASTSATPATDPSSGGGDTGNGTSDPNDLPTSSDPAISTNVVCDGGGECNLIKKFIDPTIKVLSALVGVVAVIAIILGAIQVMTSEGDPQKAASGKNHVRNALIGLVAYVFLFALLQFLVPGGIV